MWKPVLKVAVSLLLVGWLAWQLDWGPVLDSLGRADPLLVAAAFVLQLGVFSLMAVRWALLLRTHDGGYTAAALFRPCFIGVFFNNLLPSATGGDLLRAYHVYRRERRLAVAVSPILTERVVGLAMMIALAALALPFLELDHPLLDGIAGILPWLLVIAVTGLALVAIPFTYRPVHRLFARWSGFRPVAALLNIAEAAHGYLSQPRLVIGLVLLTVVLQVAEIVGFWLLGESVGATLDITSYLLIVPLVLVASALPITVGGLGVRETAAITLFTVVGMAKPDAAAVSLLFLVILVGASLPGLYFFLGMRDHSEFLRQAEHSRLAD